MDLWFTEEDAVNIRMGYRIRDVLYREKTPYQLVEVIDTEAYGVMLVIDGFVMTTESDEFVYHELISHIPMCLHKNPQDVLVIGGGDGGTIREVLRHKSVRKAVLCEIDEKVVEASKKYLPTISCALDDARCEVRIGDGIAYMKDQQSAYDVIVIDSTDPIGPGEGLFTGDFYASVANALRPGGLMVAQSESPWYERDVLMRIQKNIHSGFSHVKPYTGPVPTYPRGLWSWTLASANPIHPEEFDRERLAEMVDELKFLHPDNYLAVFGLPHFFKKKIEV